MVQQFSDLKSKKQDAFEMWAVNMPCDALNRPYAGNMAVDGISTPVRGE